MWGLLKNGFALVQEVKYIPVWAIFVVENPDQPLNKSPYLLSSTVRT